jgi:uncharacterized protein (DUF924 family)
LRAIQGGSIIHAAAARLCRRTLKEGLLVAEPDDVVRFWKEAGPERWFAKDEAFDREFAEAFLNEHEAAANGALIAWRADPVGAFALVLLLDQFPRNAFRGEPRAFATDARGLEEADRAVARGFDAQIEKELRVFFYLPFEHAENLADQERAVALITALGDAEFTRYAVLHRDVIARFGRFPHRNRILGRISSAEEEAFLASGGFAG